MTIAEGTFKQTRIKRQAAKGTMATNTEGRIMRRKSSKFELVKDAYDTGDEITSKQQITSVRHGVKTVNGDLDGIFTPGTYSDPLSAILRRDFTAVTAITGASITIAGAGPSYTVSRAAGSFLTDGIKIGMGVRLSAGAFNVANLNANLFVTNVTALVLTVLVMNNSALFAEGPIASATLSVPGKYTYAADTAQTDIYHTVEEWYPDAGVSERNLDVKFTKADISLPGSGNAGIKFGATGLDQTSAGTAYFTAPTPETTTEALVAASGLLLINGAAQATVTDLSFSVDGNGKPADGVVGSNIRPDVFVGKIKVSGSFTAYFDGTAIPDLFRNETATSILSALTAGAEANADFVTLAMTNVKLSSSSPDDAENGLKRTYQFTGIYDASGGAAMAKTATTLAVQDSQAA